MKDLRNRLVIGVLLGAAVVIGLLAYSDFRQIGHILKSFPLQLVLPVILLTLFNYALRWRKWHYYLGVIGATSVKTYDSLIIWVSAFVLALSPGKVAELLKSVALKNIAGVPIARSAPVVVAERITDGLAMFALAAIGMGGMVANAPDANALISAYLPAYIVVLGAIVIAIMLVEIRPVFMWLLSVGERIPLLTRMLPHIRETYLSSYEIFRPVPLLVAVGLGIISWAGECVGFYLILTGLGFETSWLLLWQASFILALATIIGGVSGLPGGLGAAELSIAGMIQLIVLRHSDAGIAGTATILVRLCTLWFGVMLGLFCSIVFRDKLFGAGLADQSVAS